MRALVARRAGGGDGQAGGRRHLWRRSNVGAGADRSLRALAANWPCLLVAEGLGVDGRRMLPDGTPERAAEIVALVDPIDGTRGLMYQKRPAWILTGIAPYRGGGETLADICLAVQTEIPLVKQHLCDTLWAVAGEGARAERFDLCHGHAHAAGAAAVAGDDGRARLRRPRQVLLGHARRAGRDRRRGRGPPARRRPTTASRWCSTTSTCRRRVSSTS